MSYIKDKYIDLQYEYESQKDRLKQINMITSVLLQMSAMDLLSRWELMDRLEVIRKLSEEEDLDSNEDSNE